MHVKRLALAAAAAVLTGGMLTATTPAYADTANGGSCSRSAKGIGLHSHGYELTTGPYLTMVYAHADSVVVPLLTATPHITVTLRHANGSTYRTWKGQTIVAEWPAGQRVARGDYLAWHVSWAVAWWPDPSCNYYAPVT